MATRLVEVAQYRDLGEMGWGIIGPHVAIHRAQINLRIAPLPNVALAAVGNIV